MSSSQFFQDVDPIRKPEREHAQMTVKNAMPILETALLLLP